ncbi:MAG TPA: hypothetical protein VNO79_04540, partial [Actinomycetota bacterium]|nr:hypothetical protein [Actinomycetota bacterium]
EADDAASLVRPIAEAKDAEPDGSRWEVVIIRAGRSRNDRVYPEAVLREAAPLFEGARVLARSDEDHIAGRGKSVEKLVGWLSEVRYERGALRGVLTILESAGWLRTMLLDAWRRGKRDLVGLSIVAEGRGRRVLEGGRELVEVEAITKVSSVDVVFEPAAGGGFVRLVAAVGKEDDPMLEKLIELLRAAKPEVARELLREADEELVSQLKEAAPDLAAKIDEARAPEPPRSEPSAPERAEPEPEDLVPATIGRFVVREALAETKLPEVVQAKIRRRFEGRAFREGELREAIRDELETFAELEKAGLVQPAERDSEPAGRVTLDEATKVKAALDGFFLGEDVEVEGSKVPRFRSFREAYVQLTGDEHITGRLPQVPRGKLGLSEADAGRVRIPRLVWDPETQAFSEAVLSSTFDQILGDSITRAMLREYAASNLRIWEPLVDVVPVRDFRTQRRMRFGGYPNLPTVAQNAAYAALTTPTDEEATYAVAKRGGTETITIEAISNDDVGAIRRIPQRLARAAAQTLHEFVLDFLATNPTIYDSVALFAAGHNNLGSTALSAASLKAARARMRKQTDMSSGKRLGLAARYLWVPVDLEDVAFEIL